jgi:hypothetical protein
MLKGAHLHTSQPSTTTGLAVGATGVLVYDAPHTALYGGRGRCGGHRPGGGQYRL